jgi:AraC-like DNA-binding protein
VSGLNLSRVDVPLMEAALRLLRLLDAPQDAPVLAPLVQREIFYRVLTGPLGPRLRALATGDSQALRVARAIELLKQRFDQPLRVDELAAAAHMSPSSLHLHFKQLTTQSPLQYQKQLRLQQARRLMLGEGLDAASAAYRVGYESPSQFSREYRRLFGAPPRAEIAQIRAAPPAAAAPLRRSPGRVPTG